MTVVDPSASVTSGAATMAAAAQPVSQQQQQQQQNGASAASAAGPPPGIGGGGGVAHKAREEILTSLHLIKDIRRLETYQRDFFLKVSSCGSWYLACPRISRTFKCFLR